MSEAIISIIQALEYGRNLLTHSDTARLDSEILLLKVLNDSSQQVHTKTWLLTWPEKNLTQHQFQQYQQYLDLRAKGTPIAYITGQKEFWTLTLDVSPATLIPRPETELLVETTLAKIPPNQAYHILDMGTGSGAIALAIASERPDSHLMACDNSQEALAIARHNASRLNLGHVQFCLSHWFDNLPAQLFDVIVSNPPYIGRHDEELDDNVKNHEPLSALFSGEEGLDDINQIIVGSHSYLKPGGWILFEHGYNQQNAVQSLLKENNFTDINTIKDLNNLPRVTQARHE